MAEVYAHAVESVQGCTGWARRAATLVTVTTVGYLVLGQLTDWPPLYRILAALSLAATIDLRTAKWMESSAPTRIDVGPGEKVRISDVSSDAGSVVSGSGPVRRRFVVKSGRRTRFRTRKGLWGWETPFASSIDGA